ncbi:MAG: hypothetical protein ABGX27_06265 [Desulfurobacteriaceae bacterium]
MISGINTTTYSTDVYYQQLQCQHRYRAGNGNGMGQVMTQLTPDQRQQVSSALQNLPQDLRTQVVDQIRQLDISSMTQDQIYQSVMNIISSVNATSLVVPSLISVYA